MRVSINLQGAFLTVVEVNPTCTVRELKQTIEAQFSYKVKDQSLFLAKQQLDGRRTLAYYNIDAETILVLSVKLRTVPVSVVFRRALYQVEVPQQSNIGELKAVISTKLTLNKENLRVIFRGATLTDQEKLTELHLLSPLYLALCPYSRQLAILGLNRLTEKVEVGADSRISDVKDSIVRSTETPYDSFCLMCKGKVLMDSTRVSNCDIGPDDVVKVVGVTTGKIQIQGQTSSFEVHARSVDSISLIKAKILVKCSVPCESQRLVYMSRCLEDHKTLHELNIAMGSTIKLTEIEGPFPIQVQREGSLLDLIVCKTDTAMNVKAMIKHLTSSSYESQILKFEGKELPDLARLKDRGITNGSVVYLEFRSDKL
jgi:hypothetical protein